ncbi:MAG: acyltransferase [Spirochaetia bacterium]|nr:acyltransferase [Spirochaetia bacterium]
MKFRPEIQGLRALAILLVLFFHIWPEMLPGGFVGVDVFFVLSGFLITSILLREADSGSIDLAAFWARRIRRLLPAATVVLLTVFSAALFLLPTSHLQRTCDQILASALYMQNWMLAAQSTNYLARSEVPTAVQHFWSLSIEEQFYFFWPVLVFMACKFADRNQSRRISHRLTVGAVSSVILILSFGAAVMRTSVADPSAYFTTTTRAWELALGALFATIPAIPGWSKSIASWTGLIGICASSYLARGETQFPGWIALVPTLSTGLVLLGQARHWSLAPLSSAPARWLGDISYALYLWHWPVLIFVRPLFAQFYGTLDGIFCLTVSFVLAIFTHMAIENPFRARPNTMPQTWPAYLAGLILIALVVNPAVGVSYHFRQISVTNIQPEFKLNDPDYPGATILNPASGAHPRPGLPVRPDPSTARSDWPRLYNDGCDLRQLAGAQFCEYGNPQSNTTVILTGDSHAAQYLPALELLAAYHDWNLRVLTRSACSLNDTPVRRGGIILEDCETWKKRATELILSSDPDIVITSGGLPVIYSEVYQLAEISEQIAGYRRVWQQMIDHSIPITVIRDNPRPGQDVPACASTYPGDPIACSKTRTDILDRWEDPISMAANGLSGVQLLDLSNQFCQGESCPIVIGNVLVYRDGDHLTASYVKTLAPVLEKSILQTLNSESRPQHKAARRKAPIRQG